MGIPFKIDTANDFFNDYVNPVNFYVYMPSYGGLVPPQATNYGTMRIFGVIRMSERVG